MILSLIITIILICLPALTGYLTAMFCKVGSDSGSNVSFRPPPIVFSIVWPILYLFLGISWVLARNYNRYIADIAYIIIILLLNMWIYVYSCQKDKKSAISVIALSFIATLLTCIFLGTFLSKLLILPLVLWLFFATILNIFEVTNKQLELNNL